MRVQSKVPHAEILDDPRRWPHLTPQPSNPMLALDRVAALMFEAQSRFGSTVPHVASISVGESTVRSPPLRGADQFMDHDIDANMKFLHPFPSVKLRSASRACSIKKRVYSRVLLLGGEVFGDNGKDASFLASTIILSEPPGVSACSGALAALATGSLVNTTPSLANSLLRSSQYDVLYPYNNRRRQKQSPSETHTQSLALHGVSYLSLYTLSES